MVPPTRHIDIIPWPVSKTCGERGCWEMHNVPAPSDPHSHGSWDKNKNPYQLRNHIIPNKTSARVPGTIRPAASWFLSPNSWLVGNYAISQWVSVLAIMSHCINCYPGQYHAQANHVHHQDDVWQIVHPYENSDNVLWLPQQIIQDVDTADKSESSRCEPGTGLFLKTDFY